MSDESWEVITEVSGELQAGLLGNLLEAQGIKVFLNQEGAGRAVQQEVVSEPVVPRYGRRGPAKLKGMALANRYGMGRDEESRDDYSNVALRRHRSR